MHGIAADRAVRGGLEWKAKHHFLRALSEDAGVAARVGYADLLLALYRTDEALDPPGYEGLRPGARPAAPVRARAVGRILQADAHAGSGALDDRCRVVPTACRAYVRRKFDEIADARASPMAQEALRRIASLYAIEAQVRGQSPDRRRRERQAGTGPELKALP